MGAAHTTDITFKELHHIAAPNIGLRAWQVKVKKITGAYDGNAIATAQDIALFTQSNVKAKQSTRTIRKEDASSHFAKQPEPSAVPAAPLEQKQPEVEQYPAYEPEIFNWQIWAVLVFSLACSVPNMYSVALQMKDSIFLAGAITATFTISPMLLLTSDNKAARLSAFVPIVFEVFTNTAGYYGNLLSLQVGSSDITPGKFLHMVMQMAGTEARPTALFLAIMMAAIIAALSVVSIHSIKQS